MYAHRQDAAGHEEFHAWLDGIVNGREAYGHSDLVLSGFLRVVTNPRVFAEPTPMEQAIQFTEVFRGTPNAVSVTPGERYWEIFTRLCLEAGVRGNLVPDAWFAALAIESGSEWVTTDRDYARFPGLRWRHPLTKR